MTSSLEFRVLGPLEVARDGRPLSLGGHRQRALLAALLMHVDEVVSSDRLIEELWGEEAPATALNMIQVYVSRLRRALGREVLLTREPGYVLNLSEAHLDSVRLVELLAQARDAMADARASDAREALSEALDLWRGPALADFAYESFAQGEVTRLEELRYEAIELRIEAELALGRHAQLVGELEQLIASHPFRERLRGQLMLALYRSGRQAEALEAYRAARTTMADELGIEPSPELRELEQAILTQDRRVDVVESERAPAAPVSELRAGRLPAELSSLIGRDRDVDWIADLIAGHRVVTVVGPGGVGKTRVAARVASTIKSRFEHGVCFVDLTAIDDQGDVAAEAATALGIRDRPGAAAVDRLVDALHDRSLLLVLDNCEHVLSASAKVAARVAVSCPGVRILATSRAPLSVAGEHVARLQPLATTADGSDTPAAVILFLERAENHGVPRARSERMLPVIREICEQLDGIPLAIELAAARTRAVSPTELLTHLGDRFRLLGRPSHWSAHARQQTLEATISWSYDLLSDEEQATLRRLAVFHNGFSLQGASAVCADVGGSLDTLDRLTSLVDWSAVVMERREDGDRYRMLNSIALFAEQRLRESHELDGARDRHASFFAEVARHGCGQRQPPEREETRAVSLDTEQDNLSAALDWCLDGAGDPSHGAELAANLGFHWTCRGRSNTAQHWLGRALQRGSEIPPAALTAVHLAYSVLAYSAGALDRSAAHAAQAAKIARDDDDSDLLAEALADLALVHQARRRSAEAIALATDLRAMQPRLSSSRARTLALLGTAQVALATGDLTQATADARHAREIAWQAGDDVRAAMSGYWMAYALALDSALDMARTTMREAGHDAVRSGYELLVADNLSGETSLALAAGDADTALRLLPPAITMLCEQERWEDAADRLHVAAGVELQRGFPERSALLLGAALRWTDHLDFQDELLLPELSHPRERAEDLLRSQALAEAFHLGAEMSLEDAARLLAREVGASREVAQL